MLNSKMKMFAVIGVALLIISSSALAGYYDTAVRASSPFAYWRFEDNFNDNEDTGTEHDGTKIGTVGFDTGVSLYGETSNKAASFNDAGRIDIGRLGTLGTSMGTNGVGMTVEFWVNSTNSSGDNGAFGSSGSGGTMFFINLDEKINGNALDDHIRVLVMSNDRQWYTGQDADTGVTDGSWNYVAVTVQFSGTTETMKIYMADRGATEATLVTTKTKTVTAGGTGTNFSRNLTIGSIKYNESGGYVPFKGLLDEVAVYDKVLSEADMDAHLLASTAPEPATMTLLLLGLPFALRRRRR